MDYFLEARVSDKDIDAWREQLDPIYHEQYLTRRKRVQNEIIRDILMKIPMFEFVSDKSSLQVIVLAGPIGAGKSTMVQKLVKDSERFFLVIDIDDIRTRLPESPKYEKLCPNKYGILTQKEAGTIMELLVYMALSLRISIIVDTSLRDRNWNKAFYSNLKSMHSGLCLYLLHISTDKNIILQRLQHRNSFGLITRIVPSDEVNASFENTASLEEYIKSFASICDAIIGIDNSTSNFNIVHPWYLTWSSMLHILRVSCPKIETTPQKIFRIFETKAMDTSSSSGSEHFCTADNFATSTSSSSSILYETAGTRIDLLSQDKQVQFTNRDTGDTDDQRLSAGKTSKSLLDRLRQDTSTGNTSSHCFLCRIEKLPLSRCSLATTSDTRPISHQQSSRPNTWAHTFPTLLHRPTTFHQDDK